MAQRKLLLDSCVYLRLAQSVHPLLGEEFGEDNVCLYVIKEFSGEYERSQRLQTKFPWVTEKEYVDNRNKKITLSKKQKLQIPAVVEAFEDFAYNNDLVPSPVDLYALAHAYLAGIELITDDEDLASVALEFKVGVFGSLELLDLMVKQGRIDVSDALAACDYMEYLPDMPRDFYQKRNSLFGTSQRE